MSYDFMKNAMKKETQNGNEYTVKEFHGRLWKNNSDNPKAPALKGNINIGGEEWDCALFKNEDNSYNIVTQEKWDKGLVGGQNFDEELAKRKNTRDRNANVTPAQAEKIIKDEFDDDIPF